MRGYTYANIKYLLLEWLFYNRLNEKKRKLIHHINNQPKKDIETSVNFALSEVQRYLDFLPNGQISYLHNKVLLEIGPGQDFGTALALEGFGLKKIIIIYPFLISWSDDYHTHYYEQLLFRLQEKYPNTTFNLLQKVLGHKTHQSEKLQIYNVSLENAHAIPSACVDISVSNACFEHFVDPESAVKELARISKNGSIGFHQIDLRDHRDFNRPLEFLTIPKTIFNYTVKINHALHGNRLRYSEYNQLLKKNGFKVTFKKDATANNTYLNDIMERVIKKYQEMPKEVVGTLGGRFFIEKE